MYFEEGRIVGDESSEEESDEEEKEPDPQYAYDATKGRPPRIFCLQL